MNMTVTSITRVIQVKIDEDYETVELLDEYRYHDDAYRLGKRHRLIFFRQKQDPD